MGNDETLSHCTSGLQGEDGADIFPPSNTVLILLCPQKMQMCLFSDGYLISHPCKTLQTDCFSDKHGKKMAAPFPFPFPSLQITISFAA